MTSEGTLAISKIIIVGTLVLVGVFYLHGGLEDVKALWLFLGPFFGAITYHYLLVSTNGVKLLARLRRLTR